MIVSLTKLKHQSLFTWGIHLVQYIFYEVLNIRLRQMIQRDRINLKRFYESHYPILNKNDDGNIKCTGCKLCLDICPMESLSLTFPNMVDFPPSLFIGEAPTSFILNTQTCIKCGECVNVCPVTALTLKGHFSSGEVELLEEINS